MILMSLLNSVFLMKLTNNLLGMIKNLLIELPCPKNINYLWNLGSFLGFILIFQIMTGILLSFYYSNEASWSFFSVEKIQRTLESGFIFRVIHMNLASLFFFAAYTHMFRGLYFGSYRNQNSWNTGVTILVILMATAFLGYVLPWGQMSFWAATVITKFFSVIPIFGTQIVETIWSGFSVNSLTLKFFFSLHYLLPMVLFAFMLIHLFAIHFFGSSSPSFLSSQESKIIFSPFFIFKDLLNMAMALSIIFFMNIWASSESVNFIPADFSSSPAHIKPEWYFLFAYAILRSVPNKLLGVILMFAAIILFYMISLKKIFFTLPNAVTVNKSWFFLFLTNFIILSWIGGNPVTDLFVVCGGISSFIYFWLFLALFFTLSLKNSASMKIF